MAESENTGSIYGPYRETMEQVMRSVMDQLASINRDRVEGGADKLFEHLACRVKSEESMREKLEMRGLEPTAYQALRGVRDSIGIRVVTLFIDDVYETVRCLRSVPEYEIVEEKDYILNAKENGYRSYHLILSVPSDAPDAETWVECGSAFWRDEEPAERPKAKPASAVPGLTGLAVGGEQTGEDLVGKVPSTPARKRRKA